MRLDAPTGSCEIILDGDMERLKERCGADSRIAVITDSNVNRIYGQRLKALGAVDMIEMKPGEGNKTLATVERIYERFLELGLERSDFVVGVGGGIVCDVTGFAASTYLRGVRFGFVPTTLLAQVDAGVGGKNGVNLQGYKNLVGTIRQPEFCLVDFSLLKTLPESELRNGFAEVVKSAAIGDPGLFAYLEDNWQKAFALDKAAIRKVVHDSLAVKIMIVQADEGERNERMKLNFGHTIGHALEKATKMPHGEAISIGMVVAANLSVEKKLLARKDAERLCSLLKRIGLPTKPDMDAEAVKEAIGKDKKMSGGEVRMVLLEGLGKARIASISLDEIRGVVDDLC